MKKLTPVASLGILAATILAANPASAAILTQSQTFTFPGNFPSYAPTNYATSLFLNKFDSSLGGLLSVEFKLTSGATVNYNLTNTSTVSASPATISVGVNAGIFNPADIDLAALPNTFFGSALVDVQSAITRSYGGNTNQVTSNSPAAYIDGVVPPAITGTTAQQNAARLARAEKLVRSIGFGTTTNSTGNANNYNTRTETGVVLADANDTSGLITTGLSSFVGGDTIEYIFAAVAFQTITSSGNFNTVNTSLARGAVEIIYTYDTSLAVPLPGAVWGLMMAGGAGAAMLRKKGKKSSVA